MTDPRFNQSSSVREQMFSLLSGYWFSQCLYVITKLGVVDELGNAWLKSEELASRCQANPDSLSRLMGATTQTGIFQRNDEGAFANTSYSLTLAKDHPQTLRWHALFGGDPLHWQAWGELLNVVKSGGCGFELAHKEEFYKLLSTQGESKLVFDKLMASDNLVDDALANKLRIMPESKVIDLGGGAGNLLSSLLNNDPSLAGILYELGPLQSTPTCQKDHPFTVCHGDLLDEVPANGDVYILKFVLHNWNDQRAVRILKNCRNAMSKSAELLILEVLKPDHSSGLETNINNNYAEQHDLNMMVLTGGKERTVAEYEALIKTADLQLEKTESLPHGVSLLKVSRH